MWIISVWLIFATFHPAVRSEINRGEELRAGLFQQEQTNKAILDKYAGLEYTEGLWPIYSRASCDVMTTRDRATDEEIAIAAHNQRSQTSNADCGINMMTAARRRARRSADLSNQSVDGAERGLTNELISELERLIRQYRKTLNQQGTKEVNTMSNTLTERRMLLRSVNDIGGGSAIVDESLMEARVVGGTESTDGEHPWLVAIGRKDRGLSCGGTLIDSQWVLTAAHCFEDNEMPCAYNIRVGSPDWIVADTDDYVDVQPSLIVRHRDFNDRTLDNDIAMVKLSEKVPLSPDSHINTACLPVSNVSVNDVYVAAGWGTLHEGDRDIPDIAREVELPVLPHKECTFDLTDKQFCAGYPEGGKDTCQGDSGGPLLQVVDGRYYVKGVTSYGNGCARAHWPGIYTDVSLYTDFILSVKERY